MNEIINIDHVSFSYQLPDRKAINALIDISLSIQEGEFVAIVGENGSGKSTLGKLLNALIIPDTGDVMVAGINTRETANQNQVRSWVGMVFQRPQDQVVATTVAEDVAFGPGNLGLPSKTVCDRVEAALHATGLSGFEDRPSYLLSAGETQRLALAGVLALQPKIVIFDETTAMLDPDGRRMVMRQAHQLQQQGITIIFITHIMEEAAQADRLMVMHKGRMVMDAEPEIIFSDADQVAKFGLELPQALQAAIALRNAGLKIPNINFNSDSLINSLPTYQGREKTFRKKKLLHQNGEINIQVTGLNHIYLNDTPLARVSLNDANLHVLKGSAHGIIGATGSGKSTLLQHLNGLHRPQKGEVRVLGQNLSDSTVNLKGIRQRVALAFQQPEDQFFETYVGDEIAYAARNYAIPGKLKDIVREAMDAVGLNFDDFKDRLVSTLSGGERRKVALASILAAQPEIILLDEPLAGLDPRARNEIVAKLMNLKKLGKTLVIVTHQYDELLVLIDDINVFAQGHDIFSGSSVQGFMNSQVMELGVLDLPFSFKLAVHLKALGWPLSESVSNLSDLVHELKEIAL